MELNWAHFVYVLLCIYSTQSSESSTENLYEYRAEPNEQGQNSTLAELLKFESKVELFVSLIEQSLTPNRLNASQEHDDSDEASDEIDSNNDLDTEWALTVPHTYHRRFLKKWTSPPVVPRNNIYPGEMGSPVCIPYTQCDLMKKRFSENYFNVLASDMMSLNRSLNDVRHNDCKLKNYPSKLPTTSVVIAFHNEAWSTLLRTVWSVINRSPRPLLKEIILVDDASEKEYLREKLESYVKMLPIPAFVLRTVNRTGVVGARLLGARHVQGQVITFLDSHCECTEGWLEPLLTRIALDRTTVVSPIVDIISDRTFEYTTTSSEVWWGFDWELHFRWYRLPFREMKRSNHTEPIRSPTISGLLSVDKEFFFEIGAFDEGFEIWGGENIEMSFRVWQCGGTLEIIPCSRVGHVFRDRSPYTFPAGVEKTVSHNLARVADVWLDEWREFYYAVNQGAAKHTRKAGDVTSRKALRKRLKCKSFRWFLENIYPETQLPLDHFYVGGIRSVKSQNCLDTLDKRSRILGSGNCSGLSGHQIFVYTKHHQILSNNNCLDAKNSEGPVYAERCNGMMGNQKWNYDKDNKTIKHVKSGNCLTSTSSHSPLPTLKPCNNEPSQQWLMESPLEWQAGNAFVSHEP